MTDTDLLPAATGVTAPTLLSIANETAFFVVQERIEVPGPVNEVCDAESVQTGAEGVVIVMLAGQVTVPPAPVAVSVYVVFFVGETEVEPPETGVTEPTPLIDALVAFCVVQVSVEAPPAAIEVWLATSVHTGFGGTMVTVVVQLSLPELLLMLSL